MKKYRTHTAEFKRDLIDRIEKNETTITEAAREYNISHSLIEKWRDKFQSGTLAERSTPRERQLEKELDLYKKKVGELTLEVDFLKKLKEFSASRKKSTSSIITGNNLEASKRPVP